MSNTNNSSVAHLVTNTARLLYFSLLLSPTLLGAAEFSIVNN